MSSSATRGAAKRQTNSTKERTGCISFCGLMNFPMTLATESDQVVLDIRTLSAFEMLMMDFDAGKRTAELAAPAVAL
jgi:hypothetical protein